MATTENGAAVGADDEQDERRPTERVILERVRALVIPDEATDDQIRQAIEALRGGKRARAGHTTAEAWVEVARHVGATKRAAIEAYAGKAGTADARVGAFRAPSVTAWKGALEHQRPPQPLIEAQVID